MISLPSQLWLARWDHQLWAWGGQLRGSGCPAHRRWEFRGQEQDKTLFLGGPSPWGSWVSVCLRLPNTISHAPPPAFVKS